jgi:glycosyltransferase involved in cell wall biosynthesis
MRTVYIHQNAPGQFRHLITAQLLRGDLVVVIGQQDAIDRWAPSHPNLATVGYRLPEALSGRRADPVEVFAQQVQRGRLVAQILRGLVQRQLTPDLIVGHPGWGELMFVRSVLPTLPLLSYCEFYYHDRGTDVDFDPEFPPGPLQNERLQIARAALLLTLHDMNAGVSPTAWQRAQFPPAMQPAIEVIHEGVDTLFFTPDANSSVHIGERVFKHGDPVVSFTARNLEPYRGFHTLMRCLPSLQALAPRAEVVIVGGDEVSYGVRLPPGETYRARLTAELGSRVDWSRVTFSPRLPLATYRTLLQVSAVHVHMNYPFVLSWSAVEALAAGCCIVASDTPPVCEVMRDGDNAMLVDFFDHGALAERINQALAGGPGVQRLRDAARRGALAHFDRRDRVAAGLALLDRTAQRRADGA